MLIEVSLTLCAGVTVIPHQYPWLHPLKCIDLGLLHRSTDNVTTLTVLSRWAVIFQIWLIPRQGTHLAATVCPMFLAILQ